MSEEDLRPEQSGAAQSSMNVPELAAIAAEVTVTAEQQQGIQDACNTIISAVDEFTKGVSAKALELQLAMQEVLPRLKSLIVSGSYLYLYEEVDSVASMLQGMVDDMHPTVDGQPTAIDDLNASKDRFIADAVAGDVVEAMFVSEDPDEFNGLSGRLTASSVNLRGFASHTAAHYNENFRLLQRRLDDVAGTTQQAGAGELAQLTFRAAHEIVPPVSADVNRLASAFETNVIQSTTTLENRIAQVREMKF